MVGFDPRVSPEIPQYVYGVCGALSGFVTRFLTQPLDVCKIRFQLQVEPIHVHASQSKYRGLLQAVRVIASEEGVSALWKGTVPGQALSVLYGIVEFAAFEHLSKRLHAAGIFQSPKDPSAYFICGGIGGMTATIAAQPLDVIRTRLVSQGTQKVYKGVYHSVVSISRQEGIRGFYRGLVPSLLQTAPNSGANFAFYSICQRMYRRISGQDLTRSKSSPLESLTCGFVAGAASKSVVYPLDVLKKRLQIQGFEEGRRGFGRFIRVFGLRHSIKSTYALEGLGGFFKGFMPSLLKAAFSTGFTFFFYEQFLRGFTAMYVTARRKESW